jgi:DNA repair exonuclease SbcCD nuclease subunit
MIIVGDIHLDKRFPYTNSKTHLRWLQLQDSTLNRIFKSGEAAIQVGDLFDKFMVTAEQFIRADSIVAKRCLRVIAGNHDTSNNTDKKSAVHLLQNATHYPTCLPYGGVNYVIVPHQLTQEQFEIELGALDNLTDTQTPNILLLHCNYGDREGTQTENYLRPDMAKKLLTKFNGIVFGHEHNGGTRAKNVIAVGSILPMNFGEMADKYVWNVEEWAPELIWSAGESYRQWSFQEFLREPLQPLQFVEIYGEVTAAESLAVKRLIATWYSESETIIAIKDSTTPLRIDSEVAEERISQADWETTVLALLTDSEKQLFQEIKNEIENPNAD